MTRSPLIWFGGKSKMAKDIIRLMPAHKCYVEPFGGERALCLQSLRWRMRFTTISTGTL